MSEPTLCVLMVHNRYLEAGGEDVAVAAESALLESRGHEVHRYDSSNESITQLNAVHAGLTAVWNRGARSELARLADKVRPDIVHFHNTFPWLSPAVFYAFKGKTALVQTLHNYRMVCPAATLMRAGQPCEECVGGFGWAGVRHACYRESRTATLATAIMTQTHHALGTWTRKIDAYIALTPFTRDVFVRGGVPAARLHVKPNFLSNDPGVGSERGEHFLYVGRLAEEKGVRVLLRAWQSMREPPPLRIVGTGPLAEEVLAVAASTRAIRVSGWLEREDVLTEMKSARALIMPTLWYEGFPFTLCEAMATGCPIIASDIANVRDVLGNGSAGLLFPTGDALSLAALVTRVASDEAQLRPIAAAARMRYEQEYSADVNYARLMQIYQVAAQQHRMTA